MSRYVLLDVFTARPMAGNALAVFPDAPGVPAGVMQAVARELNLSETVFLGEDPPDGADAYARIFTPTTELPFAGHPLLGTAVVLARALGADRPVVQTSAGRFELQVEDAQGPAPTATLTHEMEAPEPFAQVPELLGALGVESTALPVEQVVNGATHVLVALAEPRLVADLRPDLVALSGLGELAVSCFARDAGAWRTRMFAPALGVSEDPATGSAAGPVAAHVCRHGLAECGTWLQFHQGEAVGRPSTLWACVQGTPRQIDRALVRGQAVVVGEGRLSFGDQSS